MGSEWSLKSYEVGARSKAKLDYAIRVTCNENYYGDQCSDYCRSRDDNHGHFLCSEKGQITCLPGWHGTESYCKTRTYRCSLLCLFIDTESPQSLLTALVVDTYSSMCSGMRQRSRLLQSTERLQVSYRENNKWMCFC